MSKKFIVETEAGNNEMCEGLQKNLNAYFDQNPYQGAIRTFDRAGVTVVVVRDVRGEVTAA